MGSFDPQREELVHLAGDAPDPSGSGLVGHQASLNLSRTALGHPKIRYRDLVIEADVYALPGVPMYVHILCPKCRHALKIAEDRKHIEYDPKAGPPQDGGRISIEAFQCTWEMDDQRQQFGLSLCGWKVVVDNNIARDV